MVKQRLTLVCILGEDIGEFAKGGARNAFNTTKSWIVISKGTNDSTEERFYLVSDGKVLCELTAGEPTLFLHALFLLLSLHYACNLEYMKEPVHDVHFFEELFIGITPKKKYQNTVF